MLFATLLDVPTVLWWIGLAGLNETLLVSWPDSLNGPCDSLTRESYYWMSEPLWLISTCWISLSYAKDMRPADSGAWVKSAPDFLCGTSLMLVGLTE